MYKRTITPNRMREIEQAAIKAGVPSFLLMEHAAVAVADEIASMLPMGESAPVLFICGSGNNGGDGSAAARIYAMRGGKAEVLFIGNRESLSGDAKINFDLLSLFGISVMDDFSHITRPALIVDALFGIGLSRPLQGVYRQAIRSVNELAEELNIPILSIDIPSGVYAGDGSAFDAIKASRTITFEWAKPGHYLYPGRFLCGETIVKPIGLNAILAQAPDGPEIIDGAEKMPKRHPDTHKGDYGHLLIIAGSIGMAGAAALCAKAATASGAGLVTVACPRSILPIVQALSPCAMAYGLPERSGAISDGAALSLKRIMLGKDAIAIGPGLGAASPRILRMVLDSELPCIIDADAIKLLKEILPEYEKLPQAIITPHPGEFSYLTDMPIKEVTKAPIKAAAELAEKHGFTVLLKGASTVIVKGDSGQSYIGILGTPGMATGGSGDVLTGIMAAMLGTNMLKPEVRAYALHALAGEQAAKKRGETSMSALDIVDSLPIVLKDISK